MLGFAQQETNQVATRGTIYGGYSLLHSNNNDLGSSIGGTNFNLGGSLNGWDGQGTFNFTRHFGVTADFSGNSRQLAGVSFLGFSAGTQQHLYNSCLVPLQPHTSARARCSDTPCLAPRIRTCRPA
jgi:hypothetical protein